MVPALNILEKISIEKIKEHCFYLADIFRDGISDLGVEILDSQFSSERSQIVAFKVKGIDSDITQKKLVDNGVMMSAHYGDLRASFSLFNTLNEVKRAVEIVEEVK